MLPAAFAACLLTGARATTLPPSPPLQLHHGRGSAFSEKAGRQKQARLTLPCLRCLCEAVFFNKDKTHLTLRPKHPLMKVLLAFFKAYLTGEMCLPQNPHLPHCNPCKKPSWRPVSVIPALCGG